MVNEPMFLSRRDRKRKMNYLNLDGECDTEILPIELRMKPVVLANWHFFEEKEKLYNLLV